MDETIPGPAYLVRTPRLTIRCWEPSDALLLKAAVDASIEHLLPWMPWAHTEPEELQTKIDRLRHFRGMFDMGNDFFYAIFDPAETRVLGGSGLHTRVGTGAREIGYWIHQEEIGRGYASETTAALTKVAFEIDRVDRVEIRCDPRNTRSAAVPARLGFTNEGVLRARTRDHEGVLRDSMVWTLLAGEYPESPAAAAEIAAFDVIGRRIL